MATNTPSSPTITIKVEFSGGLELLFSNQRSHTVTIPSSIDEGENGKKPADLAFLIRYLRDNLLKERVELFVEGETVRPGILVLVNDTDWELEGEGEQFKAGLEVYATIDGVKLAMPPRSVRLQVCGRRFFPVSVRRTCISGITQSIEIFSNNVLSELQVISSGSVRVHCLELEATYSNALIFVVSLPTDRFISTAS
ncbi:Ubiquitin-related modifier 1 [Hypsizygus marmoreus]|uniref:Ubiquitin-related modifier 1 n=1 Tax=Hypsizygus marmoreus TaxID=39966 RepID=A0A369JDP3_HYPMA|nr:Ubiquitin-related modifier 1 [Hypsizygus marmoreus]